MTEEQYEVLLKEVRRNRNLTIFLIVLVVLLIGLILGMGVYAAGIYAQYDEDIAKVFETMSQLRALTDRLQADYDKYANQLDSVVSTMNELKSYIEGLKEFASSLSSIKWPFG